MWFIYNEGDINRAAIEALKKNIKDPLECKFNANKELEIRIRDTKMVFGVETKFAVQQTTIGQLIHDRKAPGKQLLLIAGYVPDNMGNKLKDGGIYYIDTAGNAFIDCPNFYIYVKGNKPDYPYNKKPRKTAFTATGLRVIFAFLRDERLVNKPYREIAAKAGVALGNISNTIRELIAHGYMIDMGKKGFKLNMKEQLLDRFVAEYPEKLRPKIFMGQFKGDAAKWKDLDLTGGHAQWGAEPAAAKLTDSLKPQIMTIYADHDHVAEVLIANRLTADENGQFGILERFWGLADEDMGKETVPPILIYADLIATGDQRNVEIAGKIYDEYILRHIG